MSNNDQDFLKNLLDASSPQQMLALATLDNLINLPPETADAAYRCALVHWFNADIIQELTAEGEPEHLGRPFDRSQDHDPADLYRQLQTLPFIEEYAGYGHRFHDLTRQALLNYLWHKENDFYIWISELAVDYFEDALNQQFLAAENNDGMVNWDLLVELAYHSLIAYPSLTLEDFPEWLDKLMEIGQMGHCHALVQVAEEHLEAGRLDPETAVTVRFWRCYVAYHNNDYSLVETIARELMAKSDEDLPEWIRRAVVYYWATSLRQMGEYDDAYSLYQDLLALAEGPEPEPSTKIEALLGLAFIAESRDNYQEAQNYYETALTTAVHETAVSLVDTGDEDLQLGIGLVPEATLPPGAQIFDPEAWQAVNLTWSDEDLSAENGSEQEPEEDYFLVYAIDILDETINDIDEDEPDPDSPPAGMVYVVPENNLARIWLRFGYLSHYRGEYDRAAACTRLSGQIYEDLDDVYGVQGALQLLYSLGAVTGNLDLMEMGVDYQKELLTIARERQNRTAELESLLALASAYMNREAYAAARENYLSANKLARDLGDPVSEAAALDGLARLDWIEGEMDTAADQFQRALNLYRYISHREGEARLLTTLASFELNRYQVEKAIQHVENALAIFRELGVRNGEVNALTTKAAILHQQKKYEEGIAAYEEALILARQQEMVSEEISILNDMGLLYALNGQSQQADELYREASALAETVGETTILGDILLGLGDVAADRGQYEEALEYYEQADEVYAQLDMRSGRLNALFGLLGLHQSKEEGDKAVERAEEAVELAEKLGDLSQRTRALRALANSLLLTGDYTRALVAFDQALALAPSDPQTLSAKGDVLVEIADFETAVPVIEQALAHNKNDAALWQTKGWALENIDPPQPDAARTAYEKAIALLAPDEQLWAQKGAANALRLAGEEAAAQEKYRWIVEQVLAAESIDEGDYSLLGWCYYSLGEFEEAIAWLKRAVSRDIEVLSDLFDLALCYLCQADEPEAVAQYQNAVAQIQARPKLRQRGLLYIARFDLQEALAERPFLVELPATHTITTLLDEAWQRVTEA